MKTILSAGPEPKAVTGIVFAYIHYNRPSRLLKSLATCIPNLRPNDALIIIDNGSTPENYNLLISSLPSLLQTAPSNVSILIFRIDCNAGGIAALRHLIDLVIKSLHKASHFLLLGDDDLLDQSLRQQIQSYIKDYRWITWGYDYFYWSIQKAVQATHHDHRVLTSSSKTLFSAWLNSVQGKRQPYNVEQVLPKQAHSSCSLIPIPALLAASQNLITSILYPFGDVSFCLYLQYASTSIHINKPLTLIGRDSNYGMTDPITMARNHPSRLQCVGLPSHPKYVAITITEALIVLNYTKLLLPALKFYLLSHFRQTYLSGAFITLLFQTPSRRRLLSLISEDIALIIYLSLSISYPKTFSARLYHKLRISDVVLNPKRLLTITPQTLSL